MKNVYQILVGKPEGLPRLIRANIIKIEVK